MPGGVATDQWNSTPKNTTLHIIIDTLCYETVLPFVSPFIHLFGRDKSFEGQHFKFPSDLVLQTVLLMYEEVSGDIIRARTEQAGPMWRWTKIILNPQKTHSHNDRAVFLLWFSYL